MYPTDIMNIGRTFIREIAEYQSPSVIGTNHTFNNGVLRLTDNLQTLCKDLILEDQRFRAHKMATPGRYQTLIDRIEIVRNNHTQLVQQLDSLYNASVGTSSSSRRYPSGISTMWRNTCNQLVKVIQQEIKTLESERSA